MACRADSPAVTEAEISELSPQVPEWEIVVESGVRKLDRRFRFPNFVEAVAFANSVAVLAEAENHHPRIAIEWGKVTVTWWTHKIKNLHHNDFIGAAKTDELFAAGHTASG